MLIGLGGGAASSGGTRGAGEARPTAGDEARHGQEIGRAEHDCAEADRELHRRKLDFASVQRDNAEMQRRAQEVIDSCTRLGDRNPILSIHDVGAGGLANAVPEVVHADGRGAHLELGAIPTADPGMSPMEIWCNEAQERYVLALAPPDRSRLASICRRERCPFSVIGTVTDSPGIVLRDERRGDRVVDLPIDLVLGDTPRRARAALHVPVVARNNAVAAAGTDATSMINRVMRLPCVADKSFLVTIGDRSVSGLVARDQMVGRWQVPVADCAVTLADHLGHAGEAMAMGERSPLAVLDPAASARMAIGEALTNLAPAGIGTLSKAVLSANWMADADHDGTALHDAVRAAALEFCPRLGVPNPGREGQPVHAHRVERRGARPRGERAVVARRVGVRPGRPTSGGCSPRCSRETATTTSSWSISDSAGTGSAAPRSSRYCGSPGENRRMRRRTCSADSSTRSSPSSKRRR